MIWLFIRLTLFYLFFVALIPTFFGRTFHYNVIWAKKDKTPWVTITFDDGPDPVYTPELLSLLEKYNIKACFFLLADKAQKYPALVQEIVKRGHEIGIHGYRHYLNWLLGPKATYLELKKSIEIIKNITGRRIYYYRPPWGLFTSFIYRYVKKLDLKIVMWSFMSRDWKYKKPHKIARYVLKRVRSGNILIFHDSGTNIGADRNAPEAMIQSLEYIIKGIRQKNLEIVDINRFVQSERRSA